MRSFAFYETSRFWGKQRPVYLSTHNPPKRNRRGGVCVPARTSAQRRFHTKNTRIVRGGMNDGCALVGRHGRAHRHRPYHAPSYFSTQSTQTKPTVPHIIHPNETNRPTHHPPKWYQPLHAIHPNETVGAVPACPPERPRSGVFIPKIHGIVRGEFNDGCALAGRHGRAHRHRPYHAP